GHNVTNANTPGYSRQRVDLTESDPMATLGVSSHGLNKGLQGTGVDVSAVARIRDQFVDTTLRAETSNLGGAETQSDAMSQIEALLAEPTGQAIGTKLDALWTSFQQLSTHPEDPSLRAGVREAGASVASAFRGL